MATESTQPLCKSSANTQDVRHLTADEKATIMGIMDAAGPFEVLLLVAGRVQADKRLVWHVAGDLASRLRATAQAIRDSGRPSPG